VDTLRPPPFAHYLPVASFGNPARPWYSVKRPRLIDSRLVCTRRRIPNASRTTSRALLVSPAQMCAGYED
jgi:hypothetical protein